MKKNVLILCGLLTATMAKSQTVIDHFSLGPYEVDYYGKGDFNYRMVKDVNLIEYFGIKKDTVIIGEKAEKPIKKTFELGLSYTIPRFNIGGAFNSFGLYGSAKNRVGNNMYLNYGGKIDFGWEQGNKMNNDIKSVLFEVGIPLSFEFTRLDRTKSSFFASIGVTPAFYSTLSAKERKGNSKVAADKKNGLYIAPKLELGGYLPVNEHPVKIGLFLEYRIGCQKEEDNIFKQRIGRVLIGANVGFLF